MTAASRPTDEELHALIDGELPHARAAEVENAIRDDAELARLVQAYRADKARLTQFYGHLIDQPIPGAWSAAIARHPLARPVRRPSLAIMALAASIVVGLATGLVFMMMASPQATAVADALAAHGEAKQAVGASAGGQTPEDLIRTTLGMTLRAPDLSAMGYTLTAARVAGDQEAVTLAYHDGARTFTLYLKASPGTPHFDMTRDGVTRICIWQDDVLSAIMLADISAAEMLRLASLAYTGLRSS